MNIKEVKIMMHFHLVNLPDVNTKEEIADRINRCIYEDPEFFGQLTEDNILDVREYNQPDNENRETD
jgi:hypothetical protein